MIATDKAHLVSDWYDFRKAYVELKSVKHAFPDVPLMALTATATPEVETDIKKLLRNPLTVKASINRLNIKLCALKVQGAKDDYSKFSNYVADITCGEPAIVYTDFIADVGKYTE